jgi:hypothetical protein
LCPDPVNASGQPVPEPDDALDETITQIEDYEDDHQFEGEGSTDVFLVTLFGHFRTRFLVTKCIGFPVKSYSERRRFSKNLR